MHVHTQSPGRVHATDIRLTIRFDSIQINQPRSLYHLPPTTFPCNALRLSISMDFPRERGKPKDFSIISPHERRPLISSPFFSPSSTACCSSRVVTKIKPPICTISVKVDNPICESVISSLCALRSRGLVLSSSFQRGWVKLRTGLLIQLNIFHEFTRGWPNQ